MKLTKHKNVLFVRFLMADCKQWRLIPSNVEQSLASHSDKMSSERQKDMGPVWWLSNQAPTLEFDPRPHIVEGENSPPVTCTHK